MSSAGFVTVQLQPLGAELRVPNGTPLRDILFSYGVEFPCGGHGRCRKCKVKLVQGAMPVTEKEAGILDKNEIEDGWRLACCASVSGNVTLEIGQWETQILADDTHFSFEPREGFGIVVDIGTTTLVAQLLNLNNGNVQGVRSALNPQAPFGSDVMSRVQAAVTGGKLTELTQTIREGVGKLIEELSPPSPLNEIVLAGNTVMHHLFCGIDPEPLSHYPFHVEDGGLKEFHAAELGWELPDNPLVQFLPCLGGFVGSDILAGIVACGLDQAYDLTGLLDLGTNGEIVLGSRDHLLCASTAAGPAFEGGRISTGMRAATGAIAEARVENGRFLIHVIGGGKPRGICGSGLVDLAAVGLELGRITPSGRFNNGAKEWRIADPILLAQRDIRELQLAKGAIAAGVRLLLDAYPARMEEVGHVYLAGAFGNYVNRESARRIGLVEFAEETIMPAGNTSLLGAKLILFRTKPEDRDFAELRSIVEHVPLADDPKFQDTYVDSMSFPDTIPS